VNKDSSTPHDPVADTLLGLSPEEYGPEYRSHALQMYSTYLEMADRISQRREKANSFFLAVNTGIVAVLAKDVLGTEERATAVGVLVPIAGGVLCYLWSRIIRSYRDLNSAKFKVVHAIERQLPLRPYDSEWEAVGRGKNPKLYLPFTHVELLIPWVFMGFHALLLLFTTPWRATCVRLIGWLTTASS
jgi:hypothetical protein